MRYDFDTDNKKMFIDDYFEKNIKSSDEYAWIEKGKSKIGYDIPFTRLFFKFDEPRKSKDIFDEIKDLIDSETDLLKELLENGK